MRDPAAGPWNTLRREKGGALLLVLAVLLSLSLIMALEMIAVRADLLLAQNRKKERETFYAVEAGLHQALLSLNDPDDSPLPADVFTEPRPEFSTEVLRGSLAGWSFQWRAHLLNDSRNSDADPATSVLLFNRSFGYAGSPLLSGGFPVVRIRLLAERNGSRGALIADVTPLVLNPSLASGWTAGGGIALKGEFFISGREHDYEGRILPDSSGDVGGVLAGGEVLLGEEAFIAGRTGKEIIVDPQSGLADAPLSLLNPGDTLADMEDLPPPPEDGGSISGMVYFPGDFHGPLRGEGVVVVHNPRFLPAAYEASLLAVEEGIITSAYDPDYSHLDPACQPAVLEILDGGIFKGLVVADSIGAVFDETTVVGAVVTLSRSLMEVRAEEPMTVLYSGETLAKVSRGPLRHRLDFKVLHSTQESFP